MTLQVPFEKFAETALRVTGSKEAYIVRHPSGTLVTAANPAKSILVVSIAEMVPGEASLALVKHGLQAHDGAWSADGDLELDANPVDEAYIAAVAYESSNHVPGLWVDAFPEQPSHVHAIRRMFDEFRESGELGDVSFDEFMRLANPNVVVLTPTQIRGFLEANAGCP